MKQQPVIFIDGATFAHRSLGNREMSIGALMILEKAVKDAQFKILTANPDMEREQCSKLNFNISLIKRDSSFIGSLPSFIKEYATADMIVGLYGDGFTGRDHLKNTVIISKYYLDFIVKLFLISATRKPFIIFPCSLGPFERNFVKFFVRLFLNRAKIVMVRETYSKQNLLDIGVKEASIIEAPDVAFIIPQAANDRIEEFVKLKNENNMIGINISELISSESVTYISLMAQLSDYIVKKINAKVILIPHEIRLTNVKDPPAHSGKIKGDDISAVKRVFSQVIEKKNVIPITSTYEYDEIKAIIGQCDLFIGARTHSIIAALSMGIPTIGIAYSHKTPGIMRMFGLEEYVLDFRSINLPALISKTDDLFYKRDSIRERLLTNAERLKQEVWRIGTAVS
jgi:colanic acid/amylovoran biosynthesis protein